MQPSKLGPPFSGNGQERPYECALIRALEASGMQPDKLVHNFLGTDRDFPMNVHSSQGCQALITAYMWLSHQQQYWHVWVETYRVR